MKYPFTEQQFKDACDTWGCNCGPTALAFALQAGLEAVRHAIPDFDRKRYTSPTMMRQALEFFGVRWVSVKVPARNSGWPDVEGMFDPAVALVRVQWSGPWTKPGMNPRRAYGHTHWIACWSENAGPEFYEPHRHVFDCNGGIRSLASWEDEIVPILTKYPRADGGWFPTHIWRLEDCGLLAAPLAAAAAEGVRT